MRLNTGELYNTAARKNLASLEHALGAYMIISVGDAKAQHQRVSGQCERPRAQASE